MDLNKLGKDFALLQRLPIAFQMKAELLPITYKAL